MLTKDTSEPVTKDVCHSVDPIQDVIGSNGLLGNDQVAVQIIFLLNEDNVPSKWLHLCMCGSSNLFSTMDLAF